MTNLIIDTPTLKKYRDGVLEYVEFSQLTLDARWEIDHNLDRIPNVTVIVDGIVGKVTPRIVDVNKNKVVLIFGTTYTGRAFVK